MSRPTTPTSEFFSNFEGFLKKFKLTTENDKDQEILTLANLDSGRIRKFIVKKVDERSLFGRRNSQKSTKDENENKSKKSSSRKNSQKKNNKNLGSPSVNNNKRRFSTSSLSSLKSSCSLKRFSSSKSLNSNSESSHKKKRRGSFGSGKYKINCFSSDSELEVDDVFESAEAEMTISDQGDDITKRTFDNEGLVSDDLEDDEIVDIKREETHIDMEETKDEREEEEMSDLGSVTSLESSPSGSPRFHLKMSPIPKRNRKKNNTSDPSHSPVSFRSGYQSNRSSISSVRKGILKKTNSCTTINMEMANMSRPDSPTENGFAYKSTESINDTHSNGDTTRFARTKDNPHLHHQRSFNRVKFILDSGRPDNITGDYDDIKIEKNNDKFDRVDKLKANEKEETVGLSPTGRKCLGFSAGLLLLTMAVVLGSFFGSRKGSLSPKALANSGPNFNKRIASAMEGKFKILNQNFIPAFYDSQSPEFRKMSKSLEDVMIKAISLDARFNQRNSTIKLRVVKYEKGSIIAVFRIKWEGPPTLKLPELRKRILRHLGKYGALGEYKVEAASFTISELRDLCVGNPQSCSHICYLNEDTLRFGCTCPDTLILINNTHCISPKLTTTTAKNPVLIPNIINKVLKVSNAELLAVNQEKKETRLETSSEKVAPPTPVSEIKTTKSPSKNTTSTPVTTVNATSPANVINITSITTTISKANISTTESTVSTSLTVKSENVTILSKQNSTEVPVTSTENSLKLENENLVNVGKNTTNDERKASTGVSSRNDTIISSIKPPKENNFDQNKSSSTTTQITVTADSVLRDLEDTSKYTKNTTNQASVSVEVTSLENESSMSSNKTFSVQPPKLEINKDSQPDQNNEAISNKSNNVVIEDQVSNPPLLATQNQSLAENEISGNQSVSVNSQNVNLTANTLPPNKIEIKTLNNTQTEISKATSSHKNDSISLKDVSDSNLSTNISHELSTKVEEKVTKQNGSYGLINETNVSDKTSLYKNYTSDVANEKDVIIELSNTNEIDLNQNKDNNSSETTNVIKEASDIDFDHKHVVTATIPFSTTTLSYNDKKTSELNTTASALESTTSSTNISPNVSTSNVPELNVIAEISNESSTFAENSSSNLNKTQGLSDTPMKDNRNDSSVRPKNDENLTSTDTFVTIKLNPVRNMNQTDRTGVKNSSNKPSDNLSSEIHVPPTLASNNLITSDTDLEIKVKTKTSTVSVSQTESQVEKEIVTIQVKPLNEPELVTSSVLATSNLSIVDVGTSQLVNDSSAEKNTNRMKLDEELKSSPDKDHDANSTSNISEENILKKAPINGTEQVESDVLVETPLFSTSTSKPIVKITCQSNRFQCGNGVCVTKFSRCDSVLDCLDHSDEMGCLENKCMDNFQCHWSGNCLSRKFVCDGIKHCSDGSDEIGCETWKCTEDEFECSDDNSFPACIPIKQKCDGHGDCFNRTDEIGCSTDCSKDSFMCPEGSCIPRLWVCDGIPDCLGGADEAHCDCEGLDQSLCSVGGCVPTFEVCDGLRHCPDGSDEWGCLRIDNRTKQLHIKSNRNSWSTVCGDKWTSRWTDLVCQQLGFGLSLSTEVRRITESILMPRVALSKDALEVSRIRSAPIQYFLTPSVCPTDPLVHLSCKTHECGLWNFTRSENGIPSSPSKESDLWPSLGLLVPVGSWQESSEKQRHLSCAASVITPTWVLVSYSCLVTKSIGLNAEKWALLIGEVIPVAGKKNTQLRYAKQIIAYPGAKRRGSLWEGDASLVRLQSPIDIDSTNVKPICLTQNSVKSHESCVIVSWQRAQESSAEEHNTVVHRQTIQSLPLPNLTKNTCNTSYFGGLLTQGHLCASFVQPKSSSCEGKEGSPLMCRKSDDGPWELQGLLSLTGHCASFNLPSVFTDVSTIYSWLMSTIGRHQMIQNNQEGSSSTTTTTSKTSLPTISSNSTSTTSPLPVILPASPLVELSQENSKNHTSNSSKAIKARKEKDKNENVIDVKKTETL